MNEQMVRQLQATPEPMSRCDELLRQEITEPARWMNLAYKLKRELAAAQAKAEELQRLQWEDGNIPGMVNDCSRTQAITLLKAFFDAWPDGLEEIESSITQFKQRAEAAESRAARLAEQVAALTKQRAQDAEEINRLTHDNEEALRQAAEAESALWRVVPNTFTIGFEGEPDRSDPFEGPGETYRAGYERLAAKCLKLEEQVRALEKEKANLKWWATANAVAEEVEALRAEVKMLKQRLAHAERAYDEPLD